MAVFPLGLAFVAGSLRAKGHEVEVLDLLDNEAPESAVAKAIQTFKPRLIGLSVRNIDNQDSANPVFFLPEVRQIVETCRKNSKAPVVIGGAGYSIFPEAALKYLDGDYGVVGEGEDAFVRLARALETEGETSDIPGVIQRGGSLNPPRDFISNLDGVPDPARGDLDVERYLAGGVMPIQGKRGCHRKCIYCSSPLIEGHTVRLRSPSRIVDEMEVALNTYGVERFFFVDNLFNFPETHAIELCETTIARGLQVKWRSILHPLYVSRRLVELMKRSGCVEVSLGFESGSDRILRALAKGFRTDDIRRTSRLLKEFGIDQTGFLLLGGPGEDRESVEESISFAESLDPEAMKLAVGIRIYPGTALARLAVRDGVISPDSDLLEPVFYISPAVRDWLPKRAREAAEKHPNWRL